MLDRLFGISREGSTPRREIVAGVSTFLAAMYIIVVNPTILSSAHIPFSQGLTATVLISAFGSLAMGLYGRSPVLLAPGMGINALFTYTMVVGGNVPLPIALGCVFWAGVLFVVLAVLNVRQYVIDAIPASLRHAVACGIGLFITVVGLVNARFLVSNPATVLGMSDLTAPVVTFLLGLAVTAALVARRVPGALILGIVATTVMATPIGRWWGDGSAYAPGLHTLVNFDGIFALPDLRGLFRVDIVGALQHIYWPFIFILLFTAFFDALSTFMGLSQAANLLDENGDPRNIRRSMVIDATSSLISGFLGTSPANAFVESAAGISQGGRTGLVAVTCAVLFVPFLFLSPLLALVPAIATAPALIMVGVFMLSPIRAIEWDRYDEAIPAFIAMMLIPITYSITHGVIFGFLAFVVCKLAVGKASEIRLTMWILALLSLLLLFID
ncbi:NCS2 family permease [Carnimonas nigrificans]|uniref:NCS2 family permease n=1 Tax=Carnimonas nigrificans TaxID=64323 RepID=UPI0004724062|nr:NCS2 family permease [Carnimonas nigrificans]